MLKRSIAALMVVVMSVVMLGTNITPAYAWNNTTQRKAYSYYYGQNVATLEARVWVSQLKQNFWKSKVTFDATSSSWVFDCSRSITNHTNSLKLTRTGMLGDLSVDIAGVGFSLFEESNGASIITAKSVNGRYNGITTYDNTVTRDPLDMVLLWSPPSVVFGALVITGESQQEVYIDGTYYSCSAKTKAYFI